MSRGANPSSPGVMPSQGCELYPRPRRSSRRSHGSRRLPLRSARASADRVSWTTAERSGSGGNGTDCARAPGRLPPPRLGPRAAKVPSRRTAPTWARSRSRCRGRRPSGRSPAGFPRPTAQATASRQGSAQARSGWSSQYTRGAAFASDLATGAGTAAAPALRRTTYSCDHCFPVSISIIIPPTFARKAATDVRRAVR